MIKEPKENICKPFYEEIEKYFKNANVNFLKINDKYKINVQNDIFFKYFNIDRNIMSDVGMEKLNISHHRFDVWQLIK